MSDQLPVTVRVDGCVAIITVDNPPVNALSVSVRRGLLDAVNQTEANAEVKAVVLLCTGKTFIAGADIREFGQTPQEPLLPDLVLKMEAVRKPWIAALHGTALGGGLEVALACRYRIAVESAKVGFPEVKLGLIPGAGGTVRLPRLIGAEAALDFILGGKPMAAAEALKIGLLDNLSDVDLEADAIALANRVHSEPLRDAIIELAVPVIADQDKWVAKREALKAKFAMQQAPSAVITAIENTVDLPWNNAQLKERELFVFLRDSTQSAALRHLFMAERTATRLPELKTIKPNTLASIGIIGGGTMGAGIAAACLLAGLSVTMIERDAESLTLGQQRVKAVLENSLKRQLITAIELDAYLSVFNGAITYSTLSNADVIIEAVFEDMDVKRAVFQELDKHAKPDAVLASNTSYLDVNQIAQSVKDPSRVIGLHFFSPAHIMKLLELVVTEKASPVTLATGFALAKRLQKVCVPAGVCDGFIGNRIMSAYRRACDEMLEDGAMPVDIDKAMTDFGYAMGIFQMQDMAGLDISWAMRKRQAATRDPNDRYVSIADRLCELGRFGRKTGSGWYVYDGKKASTDPVVESIILSESASKNIQRKAFDADKIMSKILTTMQSEGQKVIDEGIAQSADAIDVVMVNGYGFPRWRGGPMHSKNMSKDA